MKLVPTEHLVKGQTHYMERQQACFDKEKERERVSVKRQTEGGGQSVVCHSQVSAQ